MSTEATALTTETIVDDPHPSTWWWVLAAAGLLLLIGGAGHPVADGSATYEHAVADMLHEGSWPVTHALVLAGMVILALGLFRLRSTEGRPWSGTVRGWTLALSCGAVLGAVEMVPHLFAYLQVDDLERTGSATLLDVHMAIQTASAPLIGLSFAGLAISSARRREFGNGPVMAVLAVIGGIAFAAAGILMAVMHEPALSPLFSGAAGFSLWLLVGSIRKLGPKRLGATGRGVGPGHG